MFEFIRIWLLEREVEGLQKKQFLFTVQHQFLQCVKKNVLMLGYLQVMYYFEHTAFNGNGVVMAFPTFV